MIISTIAFAITGAFGGGGGVTGGSPPKDKGALKKWLDRLGDALKRLAGKAVGFVTEDTWALIVFVAGLIAIWLMQRVQGR